MSATIPPMIRATGLFKDFRSRPVLHGLDLEVACGERIALVGANGAGKTTLIRCLLGEYRHRGEVRVQGFSPRGARARVLRLVGFVPQLPPPLAMPVGQLLRFASDLCRSDPAQMEAVAGRLGLDVAGVRAQPFAKLSGGQKQKLLIAVALGREARLLVMDEPAANLDPEARRSFFALLAERVPHTTMLISSHRLDEVASLVDRVVELDRGRIVLDDRVAESGSLAALMQCRLRLRRREPAVAKTLAGWGFREEDDGRLWQGSLAGPDRLRFFGAVSRYAGLITELQLGESPPPES